MCEGKACTTADAGVGGRAKQMNVYSRYAARHACFGSMSLARCPLYPRKRAFANLSLDHLAGELLQTQRYLGGFY